MVAIANIVVTQPTSVFTIGVFMKTSSNAAVVMIVIQVIHVFKMELGYLKAIVNKIHIMLIYRR